MRSRYPGRQDRRGRPDSGRTRVAAVRRVDHPSGVPINRRGCSATAGSRLDRGPNRRGGLHHRNVRFLQSRGRCVWRSTAKLSFPRNHDEGAVVGRAPRLVFFDYCACPAEKIALSPLNVRCGERGLCNGVRPDSARTTRGVSVSAVTNESAGKHACPAWVILAGTSLLLARKHFDRSFSFSASECELGVSGRMAGYRSRI